MRWIIALVWGSVSAFLGVLSIWPSVPQRGRRWLAQFQVIAAEVPVVGLLSGLLALWHGARGRNRTATLLGGLGTALALRPWYRRGYVDRVMADAMRDGLGLGWQRAIPPELHRGFTQQRRTDMLGPLWGLITARVWETRDVLYASPEGHPLRLDVYQPANAHQSGEDNAPPPRPAVIVLHGGTWFQGDKSLYGWGLQNRWFAAHGYVVFDVQYRTTGQWPAPLSDVKCAIRWVKANAGRFNVDPNRVALLGRSAGAHLALLAAYAADDAQFPAGCFVGPEAAEDVNGHVAAVVVSGAPADLRLWAPEPDSAIVHLLGGTPEDIPDVYASAAPVTHIKPGLPPTLVIHGQRDRTVPPNHAELLVNRLRAAGVLAVLLRIPWGRHGMDGLPVGLVGSMIQHDIDRFLAWVLFRSEEPA